MRKSVLFVLFFLIPMFANASIGLGDLMILAKLTAQLKQLKEQYDLLHNQFVKTKELVNNTRGNYGYGRIGERHSDQLNRSWAPATWDAAAKNLSGGNTSRYQELLREYQNDHPRLSKTQYSKGASNARVSLYLQSVHTNDAASALSTGAFNSVHQHLKDIDYLTSKIEKAPNSKAATDLNSRLVAELAYISVEELKMQAVQNKQLSQQSENRLDGLRREAIFNRLPKSD